MGNAQVFQARKQPAPAASSTSQKRSTFTQRTDDRNHSAMQSANSGFSLRHIPIYPQQSGIGEENRSKENKTGLPDRLKGSIEGLSRYSLDDIQVHYHSSKPAQHHALAYTQGTHIYLGSGQERHLAHEAWHVVQQKQGRVRPLRQVQGTSINDDPALETEADTMGARSLRAPETAQASQFRHTGRSIASTSAVIQPKVGFELELRIPVWKENTEEQFASKAPLGTIESPVEGLKPSDLVVDTNNEMAEKYNAALGKGNVGDPKPVKYEKGRIVEIVTPAIDEFDPLAEKKMGALIGNLAKEAYGWEKSIKRGAQEISPPFLPGVVVGFHTKDEALQEFMGATAFIQATVGSKIQAFGNLAQVAYGLLKPEYVRPERVERAKVLRANLPTSEEHARTILQRLQAVHEQKQTSSPKQPEKKEKEREEELSSSSEEGSQEKKSQQTGFSREEGTPEKSESGFTLGGSTSGFTFGSTASEKPQGGFSFGSTTPENPQSSFTFGGSPGGQSFGSMTSSFTFGSPTLEKPQGGFMFGGSVMFGGTLSGASVANLPKDLTDLRDLQGFFQLISLQLLGGKGKEIGQLKNLTPLLNKSGLHIIREQTLSKDAQNTIAMYSKQLIDIIAQINGVDLDADTIESKDDSPIVKQYLEAILTGNNDPLFNYITMGNMEKEIQPEEVGPPQNRTRAPVLEFRNITEKLPPEKWAPFTLELLDQIKRINSSK